MNALIAWFVQNVWPNIVASALWAIPGGIKLHKIHKQTQRTHEHVVRHLAHIEANKK